MIIARHSAGAPGLRWLVRYRWVALAGQLATVLVVTTVHGVHLPVVELLLAIGLGAASNAALEVLARRARPGTPALVGAVLLFDTLLLTAMLWLTGGPSNPFNVLYLVEVTLAAIAAGPRWTWTIVTVANAGYALLFFSHRTLSAELGGHSHHAGQHTTGDAYSIHLQGMFAAFFLTSCFVAWFVTRVTAALADARERSSRAARLVGLTTLAAGAAHELATPLATIKVAASELERVLDGRPELIEARDDARLVRREVERARAVLDRLSAGSGELAGEPLAEISARALVERVLAHVGSDRATLHIAVSSDELLHVPARAVARTLANLVDNALQASPDGSPVEIALRVSDDEVWFEVRDGGEGMSDEVLARVGEPFFTTKPIGRGMGLGVFLAQALAAQLGGALTYRSRPGAGTSATFVWPRRLA